MADNPTLPLTGSGDATAKPRATEISSGVYVQHIFARGPRTAVVGAVSISAASSVELVAANPDRAGLAVTNESDGILYAKEGAVASSTDYTYQILPGETKEWPFPCYTGAIDARLADGAADAQARKTERTW